MIYKYPPRKSWRTHKKDCYCDRCFKNKCIKKKPVVDYFEYIKSKEWQERREAYFKRFGRYCRACGTKHSIQVHHISYDRLGKERNSDIVALCTTCHKDLHKRYSTKDMHKHTWNYIQNKQKVLKSLLLS